MKKPLVKLVKNRNVKASTDKLCYVPTGICSCCGGPEFNNHNCNHAYCDLGNRLEELAVNTGRNVERTVNQSARSPKPDEVITIIRDHVTTTLTTVVDSLRQICKITTGDEYTYYAALSERLIEQVMAEITSTKVNLMDIRTQVRKATSKVLNYVYYELPTESASTDASKQPQKLKLSDKSSFAIH